MTDIVSNDADAPTSPALVDSPPAPSELQAREGFIAGKPAVVRKSEASGRPASGRAGASQSPPPAGVPASSPRAQCTPETVWSATAARSVVQERLLALCKRQRAEIRRRAAEVDAWLQPMMIDGRSVSRVDFGGIHQAARDPIFDRYPPGLQKELKERYLGTAGTACRILFGDERWTAVDQGRGTDSYYQADIELAATDQILRCSYAHIAFDETELRRRAEHHADACRRISIRHPQHRALELTSTYAYRREIRPPRPQAQQRRTISGCLNRLSAKRWWSRAMRRAYGRRAENALRHMGLVHRAAGLYVSDDALCARIDRRLAASRLLDQVMATNDLGQSFTLSELAARHTSNPIVRRAELMVRVRGVQQWAEAHGHIADFYVVTLPSRFHCFEEDGERNSRYCGATVRDGQDQLNRQWQRLRASLRRRGIVFYGVRTVEPHHDGTPHWNVLLFASPADAEVIQAQVHKYFLLADSPDEPGARAHRVRRVEIDPAKGDATGYVAKYVSKGIDGFGVGVDHEDRERMRDAVENCVRVEAWASIHGIRQFQFFGGPLVSVWREERRMKRPSRGVIEAVRLAADAPDWSSYIQVQGGVHRPAAGWPVRLHKAYSEDPGLYGEPVGARIVGVESDELVEVTREREWIIHWPGADPPRPFFSSLESESCQ